MTTEYRVYREELSRGGNTTSRQLMAYQNEHEAVAVAGMLNLVVNKEPPTYSVALVTYKVHPFHVQG